MKKTIIIILALLTATEALSEEAGSGYVVPTSKLVTDLEQLYQAKHAVPLNSIVKNIPTNAFEAHVSSNSFKHFSKKGVTIDLGALGTVIDPKILDQLPVGSEEPKPDDANKMLIDTNAAYEDRVKVCYAVVEKGNADINNAKKIEKRSIVGGLVLNTAGIISTYHPVSAALTAVGTMLFAGSNSVSNVISNDVDYKTAGFNSFQQQAKDAISEYWREYNASLTATGGALGYQAAAQRFTALAKLEATCHQLGLSLQPAPAITPPPAPVVTPPSSAS